MVGYSIAMYDYLICWYCTNGLRLASTNSLEIHLPLHSEWKSIYILMVTLLLTFVYNINIHFLVTTIRTLYEDKQY